MCEIVRSKSEIDRFIAERLSSAKNEKQAVVLVGGPGSGKSVGKKAAVSSLQKKIGRAHV